jgi:Tfp pilus assembly protein PilF
MRSALRVSVIVRVVSGSPAPAGINVRLEADPGGLIDQQTTDSTGKVTFLPKAFTTYAVTIHERGYRDVSRPVDLSRSPTAGVSITLVPVPDQDEVTAPIGEKGDLVSAADLSVPAPAKKEFDAGQKLLQDKHDVQGSIGHFRKAIELYSSFTQAYVMLGLAYLQDQELKESQAALEQAVHLDPKSGAGYLTLGACLNQQKDYTGAEKALNRGLELEPESPEGQYELAKNYWAQRRWQEAEPHALKAETLAPNNAGVHVVMGNILLQKRDNAGAIKEFNEYLRLDPKGSMSDAVRAMVSKLEKAQAATK